MLCSVQSKDSVTYWKLSCPSFCLPPCLPSLSPLWTLEICCKSMRIIWPRQLAWFALTGDWQKLIKKPFQGVHASCRMPHASCCRPTNLAERRIEMRECSMQSFSSRVFQCKWMLVPLPLRGTSICMGLGKISIRNGHSTCERCSWLSCPKRAGKKMAPQFWRVCEKFNLSLCKF